MATTEMPRPVRSAGLTLVEIIAVLVIIGILAAVAVSRLGDSHSQVVATADKLKVHLRHAQFRAMYSDTSWGLTAADGKYWLFFAGEIDDNKSMFPGEEGEEGEENDTVTMEDGVSVGDFVISFDEWGRPHDGPDPAPAARHTDPLELSVASSAHSVTIIIHPDTGFIP